MVAFIILAIIVAVVLAVLPQILPMDAQVWLVIRVIVLLALCLYALRVLRVI